MEEETAKTLAVPTPSIEYRLAKYLEELLLESCPQTHTLTLVPVAQACAKAALEKARDSFANPPIHSGVRPKRFLDLPAEIRIHIYEYLLIAPKDSHKNILARLPGPCCDRPTITTSACAQPPITRVCRQLRRETLPIFYGKNSFLFCQTSLGAGCHIVDVIVALERWLKAIGPNNRKSLKRLVLAGKFATSRELWEFKESLIFMRVSRERIPHEVVYCEGHVRPKFSDGGELKRIADLGI